MDYYNILEILKNATTSDIKQAYRRLALKWHPDKNKENVDIATKKFKQISEAYQVLVDDKLRQDYDRKNRLGNRQFYQPTTKPRKPYESKSRSNSTPRSERTWKPRPPKQPSAKPKPEKNSSSGSAKGQESEDPFGFNFRSAEDIFKDFFSSEEDFFGTGLSNQHFGGNRGNRCHSYQTTTYCSTSTTGSWDPSGKMMETIFGMSMMSNDQNFGHYHTTIKTEVVKNGKVTTTVHENGVLKSSKVEYKFKFI